MYYRLIGYIHYSYIQQTSTHFSVWRLGSIQSWYGNKQLEEVSIYIVIGFYVCNYIQLDLPLPEQQVVVTEWPPVGIPVWLTVAKDTPREHKHTLL